MQVVNFCGEINTGEEREVKLGKGRQPIMCEQRGSKLPGAFRKLVYSRLQSYPTQGAKELG